MVYKLDLYSEMEHHPYSMRMMNESVVGGVYTRPHHIQIILLILLNDSVFRFRQINFATSEH